ncbi:MAG: helix-turn-helix domain-containing protein [Firmicutes bacterium]|nr:helix-turn-helix domain-containing protein [Bacillota bacterium]
MLGARIAALRRREGWSQQGLAQRLDVSPSAVGMYEQGRREPPLELVVRLSELFGVTTDYLLKGSVRAPEDAAAAAQSFETVLTDARRLVSRRPEQPFTAQELELLLTALVGEE